MQFLRINEKYTLSNLSDAVGDRNTDSVLTLNSLQRSPDIGKQFKQKCRTVLAQADSVPSQIKQTMLNSFAGEGDIYEHASLLDENGWKILAALGTFPDMLRIPESITLPDSVSILGGTKIGVSATVYEKSMEMLSKTGSIDSSIFNEYSSTTPAIVGYNSSAKSASGLGTRKSAPVTRANLQLFNIPWGKITLYSSLANDSIDFPVYPEEFSDERSADYTTMPDLLYQYEPWQIYKGSGPTVKNFTFEFHRDMWTGDHRDGKANQLVRFCQACCYPEYNGSVVNSGYVTLYIMGKPVISGVMTKCTPDWSGPIGQDGFYLMCKLTISITEVSKAALNFNKVRTMSLIGD